MTVGELRKYLSDQTIPDSAEVKMTIDPEGNGQRGLWQIEQVASQDTLRLWASDPLEDIE